jgi:hypothetical protein
LTARIQLWHGPDVAEAVAAHARALAADFSELKARVVGSFSSWKDCWATQAAIAAFHQCSVRTVQRAAHDAREHGFLQCAWSKPNEKPPGARGPLPFKWVHRWTPGRGLAGAALDKAINAARAAAVICKVVPRRTYNDPAAVKAKANLRNPPSGLTVEERAKWIDQQLEPDIVEPVDLEAEALRRAHPRNPPSDLTREERAKWLDEQLARTRAPP